MLFPLITEPLLASVVFSNSEARRALINANALFALLNTKTRICASASTSVESTHSQMALANL